MDTSFSPSRRRISAEESDDDYDDFPTVDTSTLYETQEALLRKEGNCYQRLVHTGSTLLIRLSFLAALAYIPFVSTNGGDSLYLLSDLVRCALHWSMPTLLQSPTAHLQVPIPFVLQQPVASYGFQIQPTGSVKVHVFEYLQPLRAFTPLTRDAMCSWITLLSLSILLGALSSRRYWFARRTPLVLSGLLTTFWYSQQCLPVVRPLQEILGVDLGFLQTRQVNLDVGFYVIVACFLVRAMVRRSTVLYSLLYGRKSTHVVEVIFTAVLYATLAGGIMILISKLLL
jgi:hypothetical protein